MFENLDNEKSEFVTKFHAIRIDILEIETTKFPLYDFKNNDEVLRFYDDIINSFTGVDEQVSTKRIAINSEFYS